MEDINVKNKNHCIKLTCNGGGVFEDLSSLSTSHHRNPHDRYRSQKHYKYPAQQMMNKAFVSIVYDLLLLHFQPYMVPWFSPVCLVFHPHGVQALFDPSRPHNYRLSYLLIDVPLIKR